MKKLFIVTLLLLGLSVPAQAGSRCKLFDFNDRFISELGGETATLYRIKDIPALFKELYKEFKAIREDVLESDLIVYFH